MTTATRDPATPYTFDNDANTDGPMLTALGQMFDEFSLRRLTSAGIKAGARCLEVGAGAGTIATWMADQVGETGELLATDRPTVNLMSSTHAVSCNTFRSVRRSSPNW